MKSCFETAQDAESPWSFSMLLEVIRASNVGYEFQLLQACTQFGL